MCRQLDASPNWPDRIQRLGDAPVRAIRDIEHMSRAKNGMTNIVENTEQEVLVVMDGEYDERD